MKRILLSIFLTIFSFSLFAQSNLTKKIWRQWSPDEGLWNNQTTETWQYTPDNQLTQYFRHAHYVFSDFFFELEKQQTDSIYDNAGNLITTRYKMWNDDFQYLSEERYFYNEQNQKIRKEYWFWDDGEKKLTISTKNEYQHEQNGLNKVINSNQYVWDSQNMDWIKNNEEWSILNENGCEIEEGRTLIYADGTFRVGYKTLRNFDENCRLLLIEQQRKEEFNDDFVPTRRETLTYSNEENRRFIEHYDDGIWIEIEEYIIGFDNNGRKIREELKDLSENINYSVYLFETEYDSRGNISEQIFYYNDWQAAIPNLVFNSSQKYEYEYNDLDQIVTKTSLNESQFSTFKTTHWYEYYCDGQLKIETRETLPNIDKFFYQYDKIGDCPEEKKQTNLQIGPNPSTGEIRITSNILESPSAKIRLFSSIGKEVFSVKVPDLTHFTDINLPDLTNGNYLLMVDDGNNYQTEKLMIIR